MRLEIIIDRKHAIMPDVLAALQQALEQALMARFEQPLVRVAIGSAMVMSVTRASKEDKAWVEAMVEEVWENAESWMPEQTEETY